MKRYCVIFILYLIVIICFIIVLPESIINIILRDIAIVAVCLTPIVLALVYSNQGHHLLKRIRGFMFAKKNHWRSAKGLMIDKNVCFHRPESMVLGNNISIDNGAEFFPLGGETVRKLRRFCGGVKNPSKIIIGNNVHIGSYNRFASMNEVYIEDDVLFAAFVHITDHSHEYRDITLPVSKQGVFTKGPVHIGKGSWLGFRCNILSGVTIGEHCIVAAGAVVTKSVPPYSVVAGCPARVIKRYDTQKGEWVSV